MAEELDGTQKPKVELIKHKTDQAKASEHTAGASSSASGAEHGEKKKVVVVKKKPQAVSGGQPGGQHVSGSSPSSEASSSMSKKPQAKVVVVPSSAQHTKEQASNTTQVPVQQKVQEERAVPQDAAKTKTEEKGSDTTESQKTQTPKPASMPNTQRPAVAAGRVGGRLVGGQPGANREGSDSRQSSAPFPQRPASAAGRVGGRPVGNTGRSSSGSSQGAPSGQGYQGNRPQVSRPMGTQNRDATGGPGPRGQNPRGPRPAGAPGQRPQGQGGRPGFGPRPGGPGRPTMAPPPPPLAEGKGPPKKSFKAKKPVYQRKEEEMEEKLLQIKKKTTKMTNPVPKSIDIMEVISVSELAKKMNLKASDLIQKLMSMGMMVTINQQIDAETATLLAAEYGCDVNIVSLYDETVIESQKDDEESLKPRPPVVTVMGHVDHGKTKLLDAIRSADVASGEFGGITQHIGAYMVETPHGAITFLDTPGHEAFTRMRARGAQVTDLVVLVVAADDGVMPQTIEALNHAKEAKVPIIVAINKIDKPEANPDRVKTQLSELGLMPEDWGGQTMYVEISALKKLGIDKLIDAILLQAEILELKANYDCRAEGKVLESRIDHGRGVVSTVIVQRGTLRVGDSFVAGIWPGKVRALFNDKGGRIDEATPSMPVEVLGFEGIPNAGDPLQVVEDEKTARAISMKRQELKRFEDAKNLKKITLDNLYDTISDGEIQELKVIIKGDVQGSVEALRSSLEKLSTKEVRLNVIQALPGAINEGDVDLAAASNAIIIGFNVRPTPQAKALAEQEKVDIRKYNIIYKAVEEIQQAMEGMLKPDMKEEVIGTVEVRETFKVPKVGTIAGCYVLTGVVKRSASVNVIREGIVVHTGKIASLKRFKDDAREVSAGYECGIGLDGFDDIKVGDQFEVFEMVEIARKLSSNTQQQKDK
jgi:translation initiation factor IF-2